MFPIYGHQGGWDEVLLVAIPLGLIAGLLWIANKRVNAQLKEAERVDTGQTDTGQTDTGQTDTDQADPGRSTPKNL